MGVNLNADKELLGLWVAQTEGAKFWLQVATELKNRGVQDIFIACVDGLKGFPEAIEAVFPKTAVQLCIEHMVRYSLNFVGWKLRKAVAADCAFFDYPAEIRKVIYTTNAIESVNMGMRKVTRSRGAFPNDDALIKLYYLALRNISKKWTMPIQNWKAALNRFTIMFDERMPQH
ncbi:hypothetical protein ASE07_01760 [Noviherbaspirillum sp. Root189]|nr:hypothetical protein ASE07_01760 [Noviherbaspirillum sp. Root189]